MRRTTIYLPEELIAEAKALAAATKTTMTALIEEGLRERLRRRRTGRARRLDLPVWKGVGGVRPGVNLDSNSDLLDIMEGLRDPSRR